MAEENLIEQIRRRAYEMWVNEGCPHGRDRIHWLRAKAEFRDSVALAELFDEQDDAVKWMIRNVIESASKAGAKVGLCGHAPSDHPELAAFLVDCGIDSISVTPDSFVAVKRK